MDIENRKAKRRHIIYYLPVSDTANGEELGRLVDITTIGMMLISEKPLAVGSDYSFKITLPQEIKSPRTIEVRGQSKWCHKDVNPDYYAVGIQFDATDPEQARLINGLINILGFED
jgi:hypothetical protein